MICLHCTHLDLQKHKDMSRTGFGLCKLERLPGVFVGITYDRNCDNYHQAKEETVKSRDEWEAKRG